MAFKYAYLIPLVQGFYFFFFAAVLYSIALYQGHVYPVFPFISDLGLFLPEKCFFSQMLNIGSLFIGACMYIRYGHVELICKLHKQDPKIQKWNGRSLKLGTIGIFAVNVVANFLITEVPVIHISAAMIAFTCSSLSLLIQLWITIVLYPIIGSGKIIISRIFLTSVLMVSFILHPIFAVLAVVHYKGKKFSFDYSKWGPEDGGYGYHLVAVFTEWGIFSCVVLYLSTFSTEFKDILILEPEFGMKIEEKNKTKET